MSFSFQTTSLISSSEQKRLDDVINNNHASHPSSIRNRIFSIVTFSMNWIATFFENLAWRIVDPNWKFFVVKGQGHFVKSKHYDTFDTALAKMDAIFQAHIDACSEVKEWHLLHKNKKSTNIPSQIWLKFSTQYGGTCFGNCVSLAYHILKAGRILTIDELKKIESTDILVATAQAVQLVAISADEYNRIIASNGLAECKKITDLKVRLLSLGLTEEDYQKYDSQSRIHSLLDDGVTQNDLDTTLEKLMELDPLSFAFTYSFLRSKALTRHMIKPGFELIKQFHLLPLENMGNVSTIPVANFKKTINEESFSLVSPDFKGVMLISGNGIKESNGHAMLLEVDNKNGIYIFYDNNRGYYQWNDLQNCLAGIETRLKSEKYASCAFVLSRLV